MGIGSSEFWGLTLEQFAELMKVRVETERARNYRSATLSTVVRRALGDKRAEIWDFFPWEDEDRRAKGGKILSKERKEQLTALRKISRKKRKET